MAFLTLLGSIALNIVAAAQGAVEEMGRSLILLQQAVTWMVRPPYRFREVLRTVLAERDDNAPSFIFLIHGEGVWAKAN